MQGIVKQATDSRYWDLWSRQKLTSELELKRRNILKINQVRSVLVINQEFLTEIQKIEIPQNLPIPLFFQDLTNQLIELERHFNTIEVNKFGENGGNHVGWRALQSRTGPSRYEKLK